MRLLIVTAALWVIPVAAFEGQNAYGPGVHADRYGRAFHFDHGAGRPGGRVKIDAYGPGVHQDETGRAVRARERDSGRELQPGDIRTEPRRGFTPIN